MMSSSQPRVCLSNGLAQDLIELVEVEPVSLELVLHLLRFVAAQLLAS